MLWALPPPENISSLRRRKTIWPTSDESEPATLDCKLRGSDDARFERMFAFLSSSQPKAVRLCAIRLSDNRGMFRVPAEVSTRCCTLGISWGTKKLPSRTRPYNDHGHGLDHEGLLLLGSPAKRTTRPRMTVRHGAERASVRVRRVAARFSRNGGVPLWLNRGYPVR